MEKFNESKFEIVPAEVNEKETIFGALPYFNS